MTWTLSDRGTELRRGIVEWSRSPMNLDLREVAPDWRQPARPPNDAELMAGYFRQQLERNTAEQLDLFIEQ